MRSAYGILALAVLTLTSCGSDGGGAVQTATPEMRRLTEDEYRHSIADLFGADIKVIGRFEPDLRRGGLLAVGTSEVAVTRAGFEQYDGLARNIAAQVIDEKHRAASVPCKPASAKAADDACAAQFIRTVGQRVLRRPLNDEKVAALTAVARREAETSRNFYAGLEFVLAGMLVAPEFLFRVDVVEPDPARPGATRLDGFSKAARLSYFLWNTTPDEVLLTAAAKGELDTSKGLARQVDRMLASPRFETGVRAFFSDMLNFDGIPAVTKDPQIYPRFSRTVMGDAEEQTLRTITGHLLAGRGDYRDLFTTRKTFMTRTLGVVYRVPVAAETGWQSFEFSQDDPRAGLLTQISFLTLYGPAGRSSPTLRGKAVREVFLCQKVPDPPGNVDFTPLEDATNPAMKTVRNRLLAHSTNPACAGCHKIMDPMGLALENFDGLGQFREQENGSRIDTSGTLDGASFQNAVELGRAMRDNPATVSCLVRNVAGYAIGRGPGREDNAWLNDLKADFAQNGHRLPDLMRRIATSDPFYAISTRFGDLKVADGTH
jgi:hypothetical protein